MAIIPVLGTEDNDTLLGSSLGDTLNDNFIIFGFEGDDIIQGGDKEDALTGNEGNDFIIGLDGDDAITGNEGNDTIDGGDGTDVITGN